MINESIITLPKEYCKKYALPKSYIAPEISNLVDTYHKKKKISDKDFQRLLLKGDLRDAFIGYIKNSHDREFSRYLLQKALTDRKNDEEIYCEDLLTMSYFVSKNQSPEDIDLIMDTKFADFETWCGFDGEMVFYPLGYKKTIEYLKKNEEKFGKDPVEYYCTNFSEKYITQTIHERAFWYL